MSTPLENLKRAVEARRKARRELYAVLDTLTDEELREAWDQDLLTVEWYSAALRRRG